MSKTYSYKLEYSSSDGSGISTESGELGCSAQDVINELVDMICFLKQEMIADTVNCECELAE
jgi:hypothetical protein